MTQEELNKELDSLKSELSAILSGMCYSPMQPRSTIYAIDILQREIDLLEEFIKQNIGS